MTWLMFMNGQIKYKKQKLKCLNYLSINGIQKLQMKLKNIMLSFLNNTNNNKIIGIIQFSINYLQLKLELEKKKKIKKQIIEILFNQSNLKKRKFLQNISNQTTKFQERQDQTELAKQLKELNDLILKNRQFLSEIQNIKQDNMLLASYYEISGLNIEQTNLLSQIEQIKQQIDELNKKKLSFTNTLKIKGINSQKYKVYLRIKYLNKKLQIQNQNRTQKNRITYQRILDMNVKIDKSYQENQTRRGSSMSKCFIQINKLKQINYYIKIT
ncbi:unnamed protein product [Paramecium sonneborni]|uniref:Uncharacterized protein n=1 Tax=Paramecium sonneborni TaxID=65129 RepID=A0A8S1RS11_9CILI|nr:unnamed protein product [Paramecium sonneborni]